MKTYYVDGEFISSKEAVIPVDDLAILRGYGVCDIMRTFKGRPFFIDEHIQRLMSSADEIGITLPWQKNEIKSIILETLAKNPKLDEANIRIVITGGSSPDFFNPVGNPRLIILVTDIHKLPDEWYNKGVKVITNILERPLPEAKVISYIPAAMALKKAKLQNAVEAIYINHKNHALEGTTSNLFAFFDSTLVTPIDGVLKGITRKAILAIAKNRFTIEERVLPLDQLLKADEIFITGTNKGVVPVVQVDDVIISNGKPGSNTNKIISELEKHTRKFIKDEQ